MCPRITEKVETIVQNCVLTCLLALSVTATTSSLASTAEWSRVAYDDAGVEQREPHLSVGGDWHFAGPGDADEVARTAVFDQRVVFDYAGLAPRALYRVKLRFFSDGPREVRVRAGNALLLNSVVLQAGKVVDREVDVPAEAYRTGVLSIAIENVRGPNAVVSAIEVLSTDPTPLKTVPLPAMALPGLTPRPMASLLELAGTWKFSPVAPTGFEKSAPPDSWKDIAVPGEWVMQGFHVKPHTPAAYATTFKLPVKPAGQRFKLRFSAVYSLCRVWVNGIEVGRHEGGFVPFECDVTDAVKPGANLLAVSVQSESMSDELSCGSQYACHPLGGISRKVQLFSVPDVHLGDLKVETHFDKTFRNAALVLKYAVCNQSPRSSSGSATVTIIPLGKSRAVEVAPAKIKWGDLASGKTLNQTAKIAVKNPSKWDDEHPNLYRLVIDLRDSAGSHETVGETFGFRQIDVSGNQVLLNGTPIKIHGICRHEVHPLLGRALMPDLCKRDAELFREGNCNFIRTSHYPPAEEFLDECDRLGILVELEAPLCWVGHGASDAFKSSASGDPVYRRLLQANLETVQGSPNHPSVIMRSMANESQWSPLFAGVHREIRKIDATRPCTFHDQCWGSENNRGSGEMPIAVIHYPGVEGPPRCASQSRPVHFGEYCHLESYNRRELVTDPGLRDLWGPALDMIWGKMRTAPGCFGGAIWSGIDDTFFLPDGQTVGYGTWGPIDGWRRKKPEFWHIKKAYSPLRIAATCVPLPDAGQPVRLTVENRHDFTDLSELRFEWKLGDRSGTATTSGKPGSCGTLDVPIPAGTPKGSLLQVRALSPRGFVEDVWQIAVGDDPRVAPAAQPKAAGDVDLREQPGEYVIRIADRVFHVDRTTGMLAAYDKAGKPSLLSGPELLLLPLNGDMCGGMQLRAPSATFRCSPALATTGRQAA